MLCILSSGTLAHLSLLNNSADSTHAMYLTCRFIGLQAMSTSLPTSELTRLLSRPPLAYPAPPLLCEDPLPCSIPALRHTNLTKLCRKWKRRWRKSPRYRFASHIDTSLPSNTYLKLINDLNRSQSAILTQLRTGHSPLNQHLFRIHHSETPVCQHCRGITPETVIHYLLQCPHYQCK